MSKLKIGNSILCLVAIVALSSMRGDYDGKWTVKIYPLNDTLVQGVRNKIEFIKDGEVTDTIPYEILGQADYEHGRGTILVPAKGTAGDNFTIRIHTRRDSTLFKIEVPVVANKGTLKKRVDILLQQKLY